MKCPATYQTKLTYSPPTFAVIECERTDLDEHGRHKGHHHGWQDVPAGEREVRVPDPDREGWTAWGVETYPAWRRLWTWNSGGAQGSNDREVDPTPCASCGTPFYPVGRAPAEAFLYAGSPDAYAVADGVSHPECYHCRLWAERVTEYGQGWIPAPRTRASIGRPRRLIRLRRDDGTPSPRLNTWSEGSSGAFGDRHYTVRWDDGDQRGPASSMWDGGEIPWWLDEHFPPNAVIVRPETPSWKNPGEPPIPVVL